MFNSDYKGAIVVEARNYGYIIGGVKRFNSRIGFCFHTPEEKADDDPQTPRYLAGTEKLASYHYFVSYLGFVFQLVPEREGAYANYVTAGKPYPNWADSSVNLNLQAISVSFEGEAHNIHLTMRRGGPQWKAGVDLVSNRIVELGIHIANWTLHKYVSANRNDPGSLDIPQFMRDVKDKIAKEKTRDMALIKSKQTGKYYLTDGVHINHIPTGSERINDAKKVFGDVVVVNEALIKDIQSSEKDWILTTKDIENSVRNVLKKGTG